MALTSKYFSLLPDVQVRTRPIKYPFSDSDFIIAKNFFKRFRINEDVFDNVVLFNEVAISAGNARIEQVALQAYGREDYDWIIILTNNLINPLFDWPLSNELLRKQVEKSYKDPYNEIRHYQVEENDYLIPPGTVVDETWYNTSHKYWNGTEIAEYRGRDVARPITQFEYESQENEKKRTIYLLKPRFVQAFIDDIRRQTKYQKSSSYINDRLKTAQ